MTKAKTRGKDLLTPMEVKHAEDGTYSDGGNLHLRVSNNGASRKWVFRYVRAGRAVEIGLGGASQVSLKLARELRERHLEALARGEDPRAEKVKAAANRKTFAEAAAELIEARKKNWRTAVNDGRTSSLNEWTKHLTVDCKRIANRLVGDIEPEDIEPVVKPIWDRGRENTARRLLSRIETVFDFAKAKRWRKTDNPATWSIFEHILQASGTAKLQPDHPALDWRNTPAFMARLRAEASFASSALEMLILTATRSGEARGMRWDEIDFVNAVWTVPAERMKRKLPHEVPLSSAALALLKRLEPQIGPFVFPGRSNAKPIENVTLWTLVQRLSGREEGAPVVASNHGFRSTARTWMAHRGVPFDVAEQCLAHKVGSKVSQRYNRETFLERRREVMEMWSQFLTGEGSADVVPLRRA